jgi:hypothetical protein
MSKPVANIDLGHPLWRDVFGKINNLLDAFVKLDEACDRQVTPEDEIGYTIGRFLRTIIAKRDSASIKAISEGFHRGLFGTDEDQAT